MSPRLTFVLGIFFMVVGLAMMVDAAFVVRDANLHKEDALFTKDKAVAVFDSLSNIKCIPVRRGWRIVAYRVPELQ